MKRAVSLKVVLLVGFLGAATSCSRKPEAPKAPKAPLAPAPARLLSYELRRGADVYRHYCQTCHGDTGAGDGFNAFNLDPHPRDLSDPAFQGRKTDAELADTIRRGGSGVGLSALMPPWGRTLTESQVRDVILYLRNLHRPPA